MKLSRSGGSSPLVDRKYASVPIAPPHPTRKSKHSTNPAMKTLSMTSCVSAGITWVFARVGGRFGKGPSLSWLHVHGRCYACFAKKRRTRSFTRNEASFQQASRERAYRGTVSWTDESRRRISTKKRHFSTSIAREGYLNG